MTLSPQSWFLLDFRARDHAGPVADPVLRWFADPTARSRHAATIVPSDTLSLIDGLDEVVFVIHGFNVDGPSAVATYANFFANFRAHWSQRGGDRPPPAMVGVLWPGDGEIPFVHFVTEHLQTDDSAARFAAFLSDHAYGVPSQHLIAHSLGCRLAATAATLLAAPETGRKIAAGTPPPPETWPDHRAAAVRLKRLVALAAALDRRDVALGERYGEGVANAGADGFVFDVLHSKKDVTLKKAYPIADFVQGGLYASERPGVALGRTGPKRRRDHAPTLKDLRLAKDLKVGHRHYISKAFEEPAAPADPKADKQERKPYNLLGTLNYCLDAVIGVRPPRFDDAVDAA